MKHLFITSHKAAAHFDIDRQKKMDNKGRSYIYSVKYFAPSIREDE